MKKRLKNKLIKKSVIVVDIVSIPEFMKNHHWVELAREGLLIWDSKRGGKQPRIYPAKNKKVFKIDKNPF